MFEDDNSKRPKLSKPDDAKFTLKSPSTVRVCVVKSKKGENKAKATNNALQSLFQNYHSDE